MIVSALVHAHTAHNRTGCCGNELGMLNVCVCVCVRACACVCMCVCVCACVCVC